MEITNNQQSAESTAGGSSTIVQYHTKGEFLPVVPIIVIEAPPHISRLNSKNEVIQHPVSQATIHDSTHASTSEPSYEGGHESTHELRSESKHEPTHESRHESNDELHHEPSHGIAPISKNDFVASHTQEEEAYVQAVEKHVDQGKQPEPYSSWDASK